MIGDKRLHTPLAARGIGGAFLQWGPDAHGRGRRRCRHGGGLNLQYNLHGHVMPDYFKADRGSVTRPFHLSIL